MQDLDLTRIALSRRLTSLGYPSSTVSDYVHGRAKPSLERAAEIEAKIGIPASAWVNGVPLAEMQAELNKRST